MINKAVRVPSCQRSPSRATDKSVDRATVGNADEECTARPRRTIGVGDSRSSQAYSATIWAQSVSV
jgi:hypothetical protein